MNAFIRQIAVLSVLWALCEWLLPDGKHQQMVRMTASLLVMTALLSTVNSWLGGIPHSEPVMTAVIRQTAEESYRRTALTAAANQLQGYCTNLAQRAGYQADVTVFLTMDGELDHVLIGLDQPQTALVQPEELKRALAEQLNVNEACIRISVEGI